MASFTIGDFRFDVVSHERVIVGEMVEERFVIDAFFQDQPFDWNPGGRPDYPGMPQRENWKFVGKLSQDVYDANGVKIGTKRGADFRSSFFRELMRRVDKAQVAQQQGKRISQVTNADLQGLTPPPINLTTKSLDAAVTFLKEGR